MKKNIQIIILCAVVLISAYFARTIRDSVPYIDTPCPVCGSNETLDYGHNEEGEQRAYCSDCDIYLNIVQQ